jgi:hypothetical protein
MSSMCPRGWLPGVPPCWARGTDELEGFSVGDDRVLFFFSLLGFFALPVQGGAYICTAVQSEVGS